MFKWLKRLFGPPPPPPPEWRIRPATRGGWLLDRWDPDLRLYLSKKVVGDMDEAEREIAHLSRAPIYRDSPAPDAPQQT